MNATEKYPDLVGARICDTETGRQGRIVSAHFAFGRLLMFSAIMDAEPFADKPATRADVIPLRPKRGNR